MSIKTFLALVEIKTKIASLFPFLIGCLFVIYRYETFDSLNTLIFFLSMVLFDMTTTAINNYMDYKKASSEEYKKERNIIGQKNLSEGMVISIILLMLTTASGLGVWLVIRTELLVLLIGMICFAIGIFYTFGPIPLSRMPIGELFSGVTMGFGIVFLVVYVNAFDLGIASLLWQGQMVSLHLDLLLLFEIFLVSLPSMFTIANLMLANNICDLEDDIANQRYTLPYYIGKRYAMMLFNFLYIATFISIITAALIGILPLIMLLMVAVVVPVYKLVQTFNQKQIKSETFEVAVKSLVLINGPIVLLLVITAFV